MDHEAFDRIARMLGTAGSRRAALAALLGSSALRAVGDALGKKKRKQRANDKDKNAPRGKNRGKDRKKGRATKKKRPRSPQQAAPSSEEEGDVAAEAANCANPGPSSNMNNCNFAGRDFDGLDLSSSSMKNTNFNGASLCDADLSSSSLTNADFRDANLTKADLHSSGCNGIKTNPATTFCNTIMCNGSVNNSDCPSGQICCDADDCAERVCKTAQCDSPACVYTEQPDGQSGTLCPSPRQCCDGGCCGENQKCCGGQCVSGDTCCTNNQPGCPDDDEKCCGGTCIAVTRCCTTFGDGSSVPDRCPNDIPKCCGGFCLAADRCCTNGTPDACPANTTCLGGGCCPTTRICGNACLANECRQLCQVCDPQLSACVGGCPADFPVCCGPGPSPEQPDCRSTCHSGGGGGGGME